MTRSTASRFMRQYSCARSSWRTWAMSSTSSMRSSTIGRSPEMACGHRPDCGPAPRTMASDGAPEARGRRRGSAPPAAGSPPPRRPRRRDGEAGPAPASRPASWRGRRRCGRDACRSGRAARAREAATRVQNATRATSPGAIRDPVPQREDRVEHGPDRVRQRPAVRRRPRPRAIGRPRPRKRARSVSYCGSATTSPSTTAKCAAQTRGSSGERGRRVATSAPNSARYSVSTNSLAKAGCALSAAGVARTSSA